MNIEDIHMENKDNIDQLCGLSRQSSELCLSTYSHFPLSDRPRPISVASFMFLDWHLIFLWIKKK